MNREIPISLEDLEQEKDPRDIAIVTYLGVIENRAKGEEGFPIKYEYLEALAQEKSTDPYDVYQLAFLMVRYPQVPIAILEEEMPLPLREIRERFEKTVALYQEQAEDEGTSLEEEGDSIRRDTLRALKMLPGRNTENLDAATYATLRSSRTPILGPAMHRETNFWLNTCLPNVIFAEKLKMIARKRNPALLDKVGVC